MKVALDAMGGDNAPAVNIRGAIDALRYYPRLEHLFLVGDEQMLRAECGQAHALPRGKHVAPPCE